MSFRKTHWAADIAHFAIPAPAAWETSFKTAGSQSHYVFKKE